MAPPGRAYVDQPISDLQAAHRVAVAAASEWGLETPVLFRSGMNAIFLAGPAAIRVSTPNAEATSSLQLASVLLDAGLRVASPFRGDVFAGEGMSATCWSRVEATGEPIDWREVGAMVRRVHQFDPGDLPESYPLPSPASFPWWDFDALVAATSSVLDDQAQAGILAAINRHSGWLEFDDAVVCHGDVHPGNVIMSSEGPVLIDWDLMCVAPPGWDHAPMMTWAERWGGASGEYDSLASGYGRSHRGDEPAEAFAELRLVAATLMRVQAAMGNDAAMPEAERRLKYWRGERNAPMWRAQ
jgi:hypothetical protein